ncbi:unnamed protein product [Effrenium voratum]|uniref:Uncharacterized protein n=1 Tax=Effrenium voratum TaxID=2562239 RepID=A0AA36JRY5_9DINO|nr:unnamed protein product [Effrenium voratum]
MVVLAVVVVVLVVVVREVTATGELYFVTAEVGNPTAFARALREEHSNIFELLRKIVRLAAPNLYELCDEWGVDTDGKLLLEEKLRHLHQRRCKLQQLLCLQIYKASCSSWLKWLLLPTRLSQAASFNLFLAVDCATAITGSNASALANFCRACFAAEKAVSGLGKPAANENGCALCGAAVSADNKSPVVRVCFFCYEDQCKIELAMEESQKQARSDENAAAAIEESQNFDRTGEGAAIVSAPAGGKKRKLSDMALPELGWKRRARDSELCWFARVQAHRHGAEKRMQKDYMAQWRAFSEKHKQRFRDEIAGYMGEYAANTETEADKPPPHAPRWAAFENGVASVVLPVDYTLDDLQADFAQYAENPSAHDQKRWEFYALLHQLLARESCPITSPAKAAEQLTSLRVNRPYLYKLRKSFGDGALPWDVPAQFKMGRTPQESLGEREKQDLLCYVKWHQRTGTALSIEQLETAAVLMKLEKLGEIGADECGDDLEAKLAERRPRFAHFWRDFRAWVEATQPREDSLSLQKLKAKTLHQAAVMEPKVIEQAFDTLQKMLTRLGLMSASGVLLASSSGRVIIADEKGFSSRSDVLTQMRGIITQSGRSKAATVSAVTSFEHITVCSWLPMQGQPLPVGVIVPQKRLHESFSRIWPEAELFANPGGSQTAASFVQMLERLLERYGVELFVLPSYSTAALCALDQQPHSIMSARWAAVKAQLSRQGRDINVFMALSLIRRIVMEGLSEQNQRAGWARCGFVPGELLQRNVVLKERFEELFSSKRAGAGFDAKPQTKTSAVLGLLAAVSPKKVHCSKAGCSQKVSLADRFCAACGEPNTAFSEEAAELVRSGRRSGWYKPPAPSAVVPENAAEEKMERGMGDLLSKLRKRGSQAQPAESDASAPAPAAQGTSAASGDQPIVRTEWDLDNEADCIDWVLQCFSSEKRMTKLFWRSTRLLGKLVKWQGLEFPGFLREEKQSAKATARPCSVDRTQLFVRTATTCGPELKE